jgi:hypothetical protein
VLPLAFWARGDPATIMDSEHNAGWKMWFRSKSTLAARVVRDARIEAMETVLVVILNAMPAEIRDAARSGIGAEITRVQDVPIPREFRDGRCPQAFRNAYSGFLQIFIERTDKLP